MGRKVLERVVSFNETLFVNYHSEDVTSRQRSIDRAIVFHLTILRAYISLDFVNLYELMFHWFTCSCERFRTLFEEHSGRQSPIHGR